MPFTVKAISNKTLRIRRFYIDPALTYDALVKAIATGFGCEDPSNAKLCISYVDCENDFVSISNTDDLKVAIDLFQEKQLLKLFVSPSCEPTAEGAGACGSTACSKGKCGESKCGEGCGKGKCGESKCDEGKCGKDCCPIEKAICCRKKTACNYLRAKFPCCGSVAPLPPCGAGPCGKPAGPPCGGFPGFGGPCGGGKRFCLKKWFKKLHDGGFPGFGKCHKFGKPGGCGPFGGFCGGGPQAGPSGGWPCGGPRRHGHGHGGWGKQFSCSSSSPSSSSSSGSGSSSAEN